MQTVKRKFRARKDLLGAFLIAVIFAFGGLLLAWPQLIAWPMVDKVAWLFIVLGVLAWWDWMITSYEFVQEDLVIRSGLSEKRIALCNVEDVEPGGRSLKLTCQSLRGTKSLALMPVDQDAFLSRLREKCPWLRNKN